MCDKITKNSDVRLLQRCGHMDALGRQRISTKIREGRNGKITVCRFLTTDVVTGFKLNESKSKSFSPNPVINMDNVVDNVNQKFLNSTTNIEDAYLCPVGMMSNDKCTADYIYGFFNLHNPHSGLYNFYNNHLYNNKIDNNTAIVRFKDISGNNFEVLCVRNQHVSHLVANNRFLRPTYTFSVDFKLGCHVEKSRKSEIAKPVLRSAMGCEFMETEIAYLYHLREDPSKPLTTLITKEEFDMIVSKDDSEQSCKRMLCHMAFQSNYFIYHDAIYGCFIDSFILGKGDIVNIKLPQNRLAACNPSFNDGILEYERSEIISERGYDSCSNKNTKIQESSASSFGYLSIFLMISSFLGILFLGINMIYKHFCEHQDIKIVKMMLSKAKRERKKQGSREEFYRALTYIHEEDFEKYRVPRTIRSAEEFLAKNSFMYSVKVFLGLA